MRESRLRDISTAISGHVALIEDHLTRGKASQLSFEHGLPKQVLHDPDAAAARQELLELSDELHALVAGSEGLILPFLSYDPMPSLQAICRLGIAEAIPAESAGSEIADVAMKTRLPPSVVQRILRHAVAHRIYTEPRLDFIAHTAASKMLAQNSDLRQWIRSAGEDVLLASWKVAEAIEAWGSSEEPSHCGWNIAHSTDLPAFEYIGQGLERASRFASAMREFSKHPGFDLSYLVQAWPEDGRDGLLVDVGGALGHAALRLAHDLPSIRCIVQDRAEVVRQVGSPLPTAANRRVSFMAHDFFAAQPVKGADAYLLRMVLHDWPDAYARTIICALVPALKPGAKVVVQDHVMPDVGAAPKCQERAMRLFDLQMLGLQNAKERSAGEWEALFREVDPRFKLRGVRRPVGSRLAVIEFSWGHIGSE